MAMHSQRLYGISVPESIQAIVIHMYERRVSLFQIQSNQMYNIVYANLVFV